MSFTLPKERRLLAGWQFKRVARKGRRLVGHWMVVDLLDFAPDGPKLGLSVSAKYGDAHQRNRFKRLVREAFRLSQEKFPKNIHLNIRPRSDACKATMGDIQSELLWLVKNALISFHESQKVLQNT